MSAVCVYGPPGSETYEKSIQDAVDLVWFSFPDEDPIIIDEQLDGIVPIRTAVWEVQNPPESDAPPTARLSHRVEVMLHP